MNDDQERDQFEKAMIDFGYCADEFDGFVSEGIHAYYNMRANCMWDAWKVAKANHVG